MHFPPFGLRNFFGAKNRIREGAPEMSYGTWGACLSRVRVQLGEGVLGWTYEDLYYSLFVSMRIKHHQRSHHRFLYSYLFLLLSIPAVLRGRGIITVISISIAIVISVSLMVVVVVMVMMTVALRT